ncbi:TniQ family protein [Bacillus wiedmannii]|uniref:TniQ family protein n=1 Tax=Bacillus wiedmannii TaxID=1890302 RepID=UPI002E1DFF58|nr:TniQ family protein [Bacillus wiedmannii]
MSHHLIRSRLYGLCPKRRDTPFVESLSSYLIRLAETHAVHFGDLLAYEIAPILGKQYLLNSIDRGGNRFYDGARTINGTEQNAKDMVTALERLTGTGNLEELTLSNFREIFPVRGLIRKMLAWCPECLKEFMEKDSLYYPLIWCMTAYNVCTNHKIYLNEECSTCNKLIPFLHRKSRIGICPYCQSPLFKPLNILQCKDHKDYYISQGIENFFKYKSKENKFSSYSLYENLSSILHVSFDGNIKQFANYIGVPKTTAWGWLNKEAIPPINKILDIAYTLKIPAQVLYTDHKKVQITPNVLVSAMNQAIKKREKFILSKGEVSTYLSETEKEQFGVKAIVDIAKDLKCSTKFLYTNFPEECKKISNRNYQIKTEEKFLYLSTLKEQIQEVCYNYFSQGVFPTRKLLEEELNLPFLFKNRPMKEYFYQVRLELEKQFIIPEGRIYVTRE